MGILHEVRHGHHMGRLPAYNHLIYNRKTLILQVMEKIFDYSIVEITTILICKGFWEGNMMADGKANTQVVLDDSAEITVVRGGIMVQFNANGSIGVYGDAPVILHALVGDRMEDGTVFGGISPDTNKPMYVRPADESLTMKWMQAMYYAARFEGHGKPVGTFRVPTESELNVLFQNRAKIGGFNKTGSYPASWYWSSTQYGSDVARGQWFDKRGSAWGAQAPSFLGSPCSELNYSVNHLYRCDNVYYGK